MLDRGDREDKFSLVLNRDEGGKKGSARAIRTSAIPKGSSARPNGATKPELGGFFKRGSVKH